MGNYGVNWKALWIAKIADLLVYPKNPINWRSTFSQCVFFTSAANPNDFGSLGTRWREPADCFPSWLRLLVDDVELTGRIICCIPVKLGIFRNILSWKKAISYTVWPAFVLWMRTLGLNRFETIMCLDYNDSYSHWCRTKNYHFVSCGKSFKNSDKK